MKRSKILSILLAVMMIVSTMSCLTVVSNAVVADGEYDELGNLVEKYWELDDGVLTIYKDCDPTWGEYRDQITKIVVDSEVTTIPVSGFVGCNNLVELDLPHIDTISAGAFQNLKSLKTVRISSVTNIGDYAFYNCDALVEVYIGGGLGVGCVGENVFKGCDNLAYVWLGNGSRYIGYGMFEDCTSLITIEMPDSIVEIGSLAFDDCTSLSSIVVPDSTEIVGRYAFHNCSSATSAYIGHKADNIGEYAFYGCSALTDVEIACAMTIFPEGMFMDCSSLTSFVIEEGVEEIHKNAFKGCVALSSVDLPVTLRKIGDSAFDETALTVVDIPADVEDIAIGAFSVCESLTAINVDIKNDFYTSIDGVLYTMDLSDLLCCPAGKTGTYTVKDGTETIEKDAFIACTGLSVVEIPASVNAIADNAFAGCEDKITIKADCGSYAMEFALGRGINTEAVHSEETEWKETLAPTCTVAGEKSRVCSVCGFVFETVSIDPLGHEYDTGVVTKKPTCEEDGIVTITCIRPDCDDSYTETLPATNHSYDDGVVVVEPTCEDVGTRRFTCQNEGCYEYYDIDIPATGHNYTTTVTKAPTCTEEGIETTTCDRCGNFTTAPIPATGHAYDDGVVTKEATCEEDGEMTYTCANCGDSYTEVIPAIGHNYVETVVKPATCVEDGKVEGTCQNCGDTYEKVIEDGDHAQLVTATINPTCEEAGKTGQWCAVCSQFVGEVTEIPATGHNFKDGKCTACGKADGSVTPDEPDDTPDEPAPVVRPATPKMKLVRNEVKGLSVTWSAVDGAASYRVYRRGAGDRYWTYLTTVDTNSYLDTKAETGKYWRYTVRAVGENGLYSGYENGIYIKRVDTPSMKKLTNTAAGINVTWSKVSNAKEYRVYRRGAGEGTWTYITTVTGTSYLDTAVKDANGQYFRYTVRAVDGYYSNFESGIYTKRVS